MELIRLIKIGKCSVEYSRVYNESYNNYKLFSYINYLNCQNNQLKTLPDLINYQKKIYCREN